MSCIVVIWQVGIWIGKITKPCREEIKEAPQGLEKTWLWMGRLERVLILPFILLRYC